MNNVLAYAYGETLEFSTGGGCSSSENLERHWMGLPLACKDADFLRPLPETVAEQRLSCDSRARDLEVQLRTPTSACRTLSLQSSFAQPRPGTLPAQSWHHR